jgi:hypothetical protein
MPEFVEGRIRYNFPDGFYILRLEESAYYIKHWQHFAEQNGGGGNKECDYVVFDPESKTLWLIEVKDYRAASGQSRLSWRLNSPKSAEMPLAVYLLLN